MISAKECVTTHLPNQLAPKMDGAKAYYRSLAIVTSVRLRCVGGLGARSEVLGVSPNETRFSADLGGSSNYSSETLED